MRVLLAIAVFLILSGCSSNETSSVDALKFGSTAQNSEPHTLARKHTVHVDVAQSNIAASFQMTLDACAESRASNCTLLDSSINTGDYLNASASMRLLPEGVENLISTASQLGQIIHRSTSAEDLAKPLFDEEERISMLEQYMEDLMALRLTARDDVDALIKLASEISNTQSQLESARGERKHLQLRIDTEILHLRFEAR